MEWSEKAKRFVLFIDILGFKDLVSRETHDNILKKLEAISNVLTILSDDATHSLLKMKKTEIEKDQTKSFTFSDSIVIFSKGDSENDAFKILCDAHALQIYSLKNGIPIKGAISYGEITVNFEKTIFFGQPIIDSYLLHEDLQMLTIILDHLAEKQISVFKDSLNVFKNISKYEAKMKYGSVNHSLIRLSDRKLKEAIGYLENLYTTVSGRPRLYIDNTLQFYRKLLTDTTDSAKLDPK